MYQVHCTNTNTRNTILACWAGQRTHRVRKGCSGKRNRPVPHSAPKTAMTQPPRTQRRQPTRLVNGSVAFSISVQDQPWWDSVVLPTQSTAIVVGSGRCFILARSQRALAGQLIYSTAVLLVYCRTRRTRDTEPDRCLKKNHYHGGWDHDAMWKMYFWGCSSRLYPWYRFCVALFDEFKYLEHFFSLENSFQRFIFDTNINYCNTICINVFFRFLNNIFS